MLKSTVIVKILVEYLGNFLKKYYSYRNFGDIVDP